MADNFHIFGYNQIDPKAINQFFEALKQPTVVQGALMADAHLGYALPIGAVMAVRDHVYPAWVGYDKGCGVYACRTTFPRSLIEERADLIFEAIYDRIPVGFKHHDHDQVWHFPLSAIDINPSPWFTEMFNDTGGLKQIGTLGGGNHFIELDYDEEDNVWIVIHSGSRNVGHKTATHYMKAASPDGKAREGHFPLNVASMLGQDYINDLKFCLVFAKANRAAMAREVVFAVQQCGVPGCRASESKFDTINRNHNHAEFRPMQQGTLWVHRKGATHAEKGMLGVIPGNMADGSYIVLGSGNPLSLYSSSHGAGRVSSRREAKEKLEMSDFQEQMQGIKAKVTRGTLDESPGAYKNIKDVLEAQKDLITVQRHLKPIINIKG